MRRKLTHLFLRVGLVIVLCLPAGVMALTSWQLAINTNNVKLITDYGANVTNADNAPFIQNAINAVARGSRTNGLVGGMVRIPAGTNVYLCGPLNFSNNVDLQIDAGAVLQLLPYGTYPGSPYTSSIQPFINGTGLTNIAVTGSGMVDGQGAVWWQVYGTNSSINRPLIINFSGSSMALLQDFSTTNPPVAHIVVKGANAGNINFIRVKLMAPGSGAFNTDGVDFAETNALFQDCFISTGDDNIAIGSSGSTSRDMLVTNCVFGAGHGLSIGSFTSGGVANLTVINCSFNGSGIRIKSSRDRGGVVENINYLNLTVTNSDTPINFYAYYEFGLGTLTALTPQFVASYTLTNANPTPYNPPIFRNILVSNFTAVLTSNARNPFLLLGLPDYPMSNVVFKAMSITKPATVNNPQIYNTTNVQFVDCNWVLPAGDAIQFWNADVTFTNTVLSTNLLVLDGLTYSNLGNSLEFDNAKATFSKTNAIAGGPLWLDRSTLVISNNLTMTAATPLSFVVGTNLVMMAIKGNLKLGGVINVIAGAGFTNGTYTLVTNTGTMDGILPTLGLAPPGFVCSFNTNTPKQLRLVVASPDAPAIPAALTATAYSGAVALQWSSVASATSYNLKRATVSGGPFITITNISGTNFNNTGLVNGTTYYYVVSALNGGSESDDSGEVDATPVCMAPPIPAGISAAAGNAQVNLTWQASFTADGYKIYRATVSSGPYTMLANVVTTNFTDTPLANGTTYYYKLSATNICGESAGSPVLSVTPVAPSTLYRINSGGAAVGAFAADGGYSGGGTYGNANTIDTNGLINPAPTTVYQTERDGNFTYTFTNLVPGSSYVARLHFAEIYFSSAGSRTFNVFVNGTQVLTNFDIYAAAGAKNKAIIYEVPALADGSGQIAVQYTTVINNAKSSGVEIVSAMAAPAVISQPADQILGTGGTAAFSVTATGTPAPGYQWIKDGTNLVGKTTSTLTITNVQLTNQGSYCVLITNSGGSVISRYAALTIGSPVISAQPSNQIAAAGATVSFSVLASGYSAIGYQWLQNGLPINGENDSTITLNNVVRSMAGNYSVAVTNSFGSVTSSVAVLTYSNTPPTAQPMSVVRTAGASAVILWSDIATNWSDVDGDTVALAGINLATTNGVTIQTNSTSIVYTNSQNVGDQISYTVSDGYGGMATGLINISITSPPVPPTISYQVSGHQLQLSWPQNYLGWRLLIQTNNLNSGLGTNWYTVPGSINSTSAYFDIDPSGGSVFIRLIYP